MSRDDFDDLEAEELGEYVPVIYGRSVEEAERYCQVLEDHDLPAIVDEDYEPPEGQVRAARGSRVAVLVPETLLEEARSLIAELDELGELVEGDELEEDDEDEDFEIHAPFDVEADEEDELL